MTGYEYPRKGTWATRRARGGFEGVGYPSFLIADRAT